MTHAAPYRFTAKLVAALLGLTLTSHSLLAVSDIDWEGAIGLTVNANGQCDGDESISESASHQLKDKGCERIRLLVTVSGTVERVDSGYDVVAVNGITVFEGDDFGGSCDEGDTMTQKSGTVSIEVGAGEKITLTYSTNDGLYNEGASATITNITEDLSECTSCKSNTSASSGGGTGTFGGSGWGSGSSGATSLSVGLGSGSSAYGTSSLNTNADPLSSASGDRSSVSYVGADETHIAERYTDGNGTLDQVKSQGGLVNLTDTANGYTMSFYSPFKIGSFDSQTQRYAVTGTADKTIAVVRQVSGTIFTLTYTETIGAGTPVVLLSNSVDTTTNTRTLSEFDGQRITIETEATLPNSRREKRTVVKSLVNSVEKTHAVTSEVFETFAWGEELVETADDPDGLNRRTIYDFYTNQAGDGDNYSNLKSVIGPDGNWTVYRDYNAEGRVGKTVRQFASNTFDAGSAGEAANWVEQLTITTADEDGDSLPDETRQTSRYLKGQLIGRSWETTYTSPTAMYLYDAYNYTTIFEGHATRRVSEIAASPTANRGDSGNAVTVEWIDTFTYQTVQTTLPNGVTRLQYSRQVVSGEGIRLPVRIAAEGSLDSGGNYLETGWIETRSEDAFGNLTVELRDVSTGATLFSQHPSNQNEQGRAQRMDFNDGSYEEYVFGCCGLDERRNRDGSRTMFIRDGMKRISEEVVTVNGDFVSVSVTLLDPMGRVVASGRRPGATGSVQLTGETEYDLAGRVTSMTDAAQRQTGYAYSTDSSDRPVTTITLPGGGTRIETYEQSGGLRTVGGTAVFPLRYVEDVDSTGHHHIAYRISGIDTEDEWERADYDFQGRIWKMSYPSPSGAARFTYFNAAGQVVRTVDPDGVTRLFSYDDAGRRQYEAVDLDGDNEIDLDGTDRVTRYAYDVENVGGIYGHRVTTFVRTTDGSGAERQVSRHTTRHDTGDTLRFEDARGVSSFINDYRPHDVEATETTPEGRVTKTVFEAGRPVSRITTAGGATLSDLGFGYDEFNRLETVTDAAFGTTTYTYHDDDHIHTVTTPDPDPMRTGPGYDAQMTTLEYDSAGRLWKTTLPDTRIETRTYYPTGRLKLVHGGNNYPQKFTYDSQGRTKTLTTWQAFNPSTESGTGEAITTWDYHPQRGWLVAKHYADSSGPTYTYTAAGRLEIRTWARDITTTYGYTDAGDLETIDYSDTTPDVAFTYDREGRIKTVTDAAGLLTRSYNSLGQIEDETYGGSGLLSGQSIDRTFGNYQRLQSVAFGGGAYTATWAYGGDTRLDTITQGAYTAKYGYRANSEIRETLTYKQGATVRGSLATTHDAIRRINRSDTYAGSTLVTRRDYTHDAANRRIETEHEDARKWTYDYDGLGQVTSATKLQSNDDPLPGYTFAFSYDDIGNRKTTTVNGREESYTSDLLNQYSARKGNGVSSKDAFIDVRGSADASATILVNDALATRTDTEFYHGAKVQSGNAEVKIQAVRAGPPSEVATELRGVRVDAVNLHFKHDPDGNRLGYGIWSYTWDGENRLITAEIPEGFTNVVAGVPARQRIEFAYDAFSRRISKTVKNWNSTTSAWETQEVVRYLYDNWNKLAELDGANGNAVIRTYAWGLDANGTYQGAGGIGGLLWANLPGATHAPGYDSNGNIVTWIGLANGIMSGSIEYGPFGGTLTSTGAARDIPYAFSTKFRDHETSLYDYGYRSYSTETGRWLNRDPIGEKGGRNLYGMVNNNPIGQWDYLGLSNNDAFKCCTDKKIKQGKEELKERYEQIKAEFERNNVPHNGFSGGRYSCYNVNTPLWVEMGTPPSCWDCKLENRKRSFFSKPYAIYRDHWAVVCSARDLSGKIAEKITFDYYLDIPAGQNAEDGFYKEYANPVSSTYSAPTSCDAPSEWELDVTATDIDQIGR